MRLVITICVALLGVYYVADTKPRAVEHPAQQICFPPGTVGVDAFDGECPDAYFGDTVDV